MAPPVKLSLDMTAAWNRHFFHPQDDSAVIPGVSRAIERNVRRTAAEPSSINCDPIPQTIQELVSDPLRMLPRVCIDTYSKMIGPHEAFDPLVDERKLHNVLKGMDDLGLPIRLLQPPTSIDQSEWRVCVDVDSVAATSRDNIPFASTGPFNVCIN